MQSFIRYFAFLSIIFLSLTACNEIQEKRYEVTPNSYGRPNNILVVTDEFNWTTAIGDTFRNHFEALYPVTPQEESIYDIRYSEPLEFNETKILKTHRAIVIMAALDDPNDRAAELIRSTLGEKGIQRAQEKENYRIAIHKDRWAHGQIVIYWFAPDRKALMKTVREDYQRVMNKIDKADSKLYLEQIYAPGQNHKVAEMIKKDLSIQIQIPKEYFLAHQDTNAYWLRRETNKVSSNIFIYELPYSDSTLAIPQHHKRIRNKLTKKYFATHVDDSYMRIQDEYLPIYYQPMSFDNRPTLQARGLWEMVNDFMGGSFVTYMIEDKANDRIIFLDGFVHAPGQKKRPEMRKLDIVFSTFSIRNEGGGTEQ